MHEPSSARALGPGSRRRCLAAALAVVVAALAVALAPARPAGAQQQPPFPYADFGAIDVQGVPTQVDLDNSGTITGAETRMWDVTLTSPHIFVSRVNPPTINPLHVPMKVRIFLPSGYDQGRAVGYPSLYLLHGGSGTWADWSRPDAGNIATTLAGTSFGGIAVMVEGGRFGMYADWVGYTNGNFQPQWDSFHTALLNWVDQRLNTVESRSGRAIAGLSMGGLGALMYAAAHPTTFGAVGSFSGPVELRHPPAQDLGDAAMFAYGASVVDHGMAPGQLTNYRVTGRALEVIFGPPSPPVPPETRAGWPTHNPVERASAYRPYSGKLAIYSGESVANNDNGEEDVRTMNDDFHAALKAVPNPDGTLGVAHRYCRGFGTHDWPYWRNDLRDFVQYVYGPTPGSCTANSGWSLVP